MKLTQKIETGSIALRNLILGSNIISFSLLPQPRQLVHYINESLFLYKTITNRRGIEQKNVFEVLPIENDMPIILGGLDNSSALLGERWFHSTASFSNDIISLCLICQILQPKVVFEIGTLHGYTAYHFALNTPADTSIYTLDLPVEEQLTPALNTTIVDQQHIQFHHVSRAKFFEHSQVDSKVTCLYGDSATYDYSPFWNRVDFFFIDGAHSYEYVRSDTMKALECCHSGSVIAWHDFGRMGVNGVSRWLIEFAKDHEVQCIPGGSLAFMVVK